MVETQESLLVEAPCGIMLISEDGMISNANPYCCRLLDYGLHELSGRNIADLLGISGRIFYQTHLYPLVKLHKHAEEIFLTLKTKGKQDLPVVLNAVSVGQNGSSQIICSFIPVLNRRKYEDEILQAKKNAEEALQKNKALEKVKTQLEAQQQSLDKQVSLLEFQNKELLKLSDVIAHDLQEPVRKLIFFSNELQQKKTDSGFMDYSLNVLKNSSLRIKNLLLNLQNYLALTVPVDETEQVELSTLMYTELKQLQETYSNINAQVEINMNASIRGNKNQLTWMFHHLLKNAFEHGTVDNQLHLNVRSVIIKQNQFVALDNKYRYVDHVLITIEDHGPGFDAGYNQYIFDVLKKLETTGDRLGFGLAFCKRIAENHSGSIKAEGFPGTGSIFTISLPVDFIV